MVLCLLVGFIMASAMMSTIPIYMNASLQRMLIKDLEEFQLEQDVYPGVYSVSDELKLDISASEQLKSVNSTVTKVQNGYDSLQVPTSNSKVFVADDYLQVISIQVTQGNTAPKIRAGGMTNLTDHIKITQGRMYEAGADADGVYECITSEKALKVSKLTVGTVYTAANAFDTDSQYPIKFKIVGVYNTADDTDTYWSEGIDESYYNTMLFDYDTLTTDMMKTGAVNLSSLSIRYAIDYQNMDMTDLSAFNETIDNQTTEYKKASLEFDFPASSIIKDYAERASQLKLILWLLQIPVMLMIIFYLFMVSQLNVEQERNEIAVFKSRGASSFQIFGIYALETLILGAITAVIGPLVGLALCQILGASNGFLEFVNRKALPVGLSLDAFLYSTAAVAVFFITTMIPIIPATKTSIVEHKQAKARKKKRPFWEKAFLDIILIGGSLGWLYYYTKTQDELVEQGLTDTTATINPMLFVASTAFILGAGLLVIRIYPLIIRLISRVGKRVWTPAQYVSLNNIGRSSTGRERFLMVFLILTVSLGLFFANTARALNKSAVDRVSYAVGADAVLTEEWESNKVVESTTQQQGTSGAAQQTSEDEEEEEEEDSSDLSYTEPVFERYEKLAGVQEATKVFRRDDITIQSDDMQVEEQEDEDTAAFRRAVGREQETKDSASDVRLMTVIPDEFSRICWSEDSLLPTHINNYLNAIANYNSGVILSSSFRDNYGLELGDKVDVSWGSNEAFEATVVAFVDYWPTLNPYEENEDGSYIDFAIMNFDYVRVVTAVEPYEVWMKFDDDASVQAFYDSIEKSDVEPVSLEVASQEIINAKNDPMLQGMNGALTLGFIIIMIMCIIGFLIYWILSIKSRTLQFGILRAMGMSFREIIGMLFYEQLLVSGVAIVIAVVIGSYASDFFTPLFQSLYSAMDRVPPFQVVPLRSDYLKLYVIVGFMLLLGFAVLGRLISKIKISQALKLGED